MRFVPLLLALAACARAGSHPVDETRQGRWRLAQQPWSSVSHAATAGDADLARGAETLVFVLDGGPLTVAKASDSDCRHAVHAEVPSGTRHVGEPVIATLWIDGDRAHEIALERTDVGVAVLDVEGVEVIAASDRYLLRAGARARIRFTCAVRGSAGLAVRIVREIEEPVQKTEVHE